MGQSLSRDSQDILVAAAHGDVACLRQQMAFEPKLVKSVTLLKRRGVLHLAAKEGHSQVLAAVLEPLIEAVREEYFAMHTIAELQQAQQALLAAKSPPSESQQQTLPSSIAGNRQPAWAQNAPGVNWRRRSHRQRQQTVLQQPEPQLASFMKLRQAVNARDLYRRTPLIVAAKQGHLECTQTLVEAASNLFAVDREGNTSLHYAALHGHAAVVEYLMRKASDRNLGHRYVNKRNLSGFTPLHYAVWGCSEQVVQQVLQASPDISAANDRVFDAWVTVPVGSTALHLAVVRNDTPIALMLLQHYVAEVVAAPSDEPRPQDPRRIVNLYGMTPAQLAAHRGLRQLSRVLSPSLALSRVMEALVPSTRRSYGPPSLKVIAAGAMQTVLVSQLDQLQRQLDTLQAAAVHRAATEDAAFEAASADGGTAPDAVSGMCCWERAVEGAAGNVCCSAAVERFSPAGCCMAGDRKSLSGCCNIDHPVMPQESIRRTDSEEISPAAVPAGMPAMLHPGSPDLMELDQPHSISPCETGTFGVAACCSSTGAAVHSHTRSSTMGCSSTDIAGVMGGSTGWHDEQCCVCWEQDVSVSMSPCGHALCLGCAQKLVASSGQTGATCPLCRRFIAVFELLPRTGAAALKLLSGAGI